MQEPQLRSGPMGEDEARSETPTAIDSGNQGGGRPQAAKPRPRPKKALPTDRMKFEVQKKALSVIAILSNGAESVGSADMAPRLGVAATTAGLNNSFFADCGFIVRSEGKGRFKSTETANDFARRFSFDADRAGLVLKEPLSATWFYSVVRQHLKGMGPTPKAQLVELLAYEAGTTNDYRVQLSTLLTWLEYAGLIELEDGKYKLAEDAPVSSPRKSPGGDDEGDNQSGQDSRSRPIPDRATEEGSSNDQDKSPTETILSFSFDFALTKEDLADLSSEQIQALFKAVGEVMAIKTPE